MDFNITILGTSASLPAYGRNHSAQILTLGKHTFLIDCGEATQHQLSHFKVKRSKIDYILISHLHGDHYLGLMGLLSSMHLLGRTKRLTIYAPAGLDEIITIQLRHSQTRLNYPITFKYLNTEENDLLLENENYTLTSFPLKHRIPCCGFVWKEKSKPFRLNKEKIPNNLSLAEIGSFKRGEDVVREKITLSAKEHTLLPRKPRSYAYCSDTKYDESIIEYIDGVDYLYHESTFLDDMEARAAATFHCTARQTATIAQKAQVENLILGHFSARYSETDQFLIEAQEIFNATQLAEEGLTIEILE